MAHRAQVYPPNPGTEGKGRVGRDDCNEKKRKRKKNGLGGPEPYVHGCTTIPLDLS